MCQVITAPAPRHRQDFSVPVRIIERVAQTLATSSDMSHLVASFGILLRSLRCSAPLIGPAVSDIEIGGGKDWLRYYVCGDLCAAFSQRGSNMPGEVSDWMPLHAVIARVEVTRHCHRERATDLVQEAIDETKVRSRTVRGPPQWLSSRFNGQDVFHSDGGVSIEVWREDVLRLWPERQGDTPPAQPASRAPRKRAPTEEGVVLAMKSLWPGGIPLGLKAKDRDKHIGNWLKERGLSVPTGLSRAVQRALQKHPELRAAGSPTISEPTPRT
jgi:hypothetical protein